MGEGKWTKKQIRTLQCHLDTAWLLSRPLSDYRGLRDEAEAAFRNLLALRRKDLVLAGVRAAIATSAARYISDCETIGNALVRGIYGAGTDAFIADWIKQAKEEDAARVVSEEVLRRLLSEELPPEVLWYDPITQKVITPP